MAATEQHLGPPLRRGVPQKMTQFEYQPPDRTPAYVIFTRQGGGRCTIEFRPSAIFDLGEPDPDEVPQNAIPSSPSFLTH